LTLIWLVICGLLIRGIAVADDAFNQATAPRQWEFPRDHGRHEGFRTEWWYFTGNLSTADGRPFGFELTFFRTSLAAAAPKRVSRWGTNDVYFAHAHVSDIQDKQYLIADRTSRARDGLAMASPRDLDVYLLDWSARQSADGVIHLRAASNEFTISLDCTIERGPILQGPGGLSSKGKQKGDASYYYSLTRLRTSGSIQIGQQRFAVTGLSWMDHEFSSNTLGSDQIGWDWICLQMNKGTDLMVYRMRNAKGETDYAFATEVGSDAEPHFIDGNAIHMEGSDPWTSPHSGGVYPQRWRLQIGDLPPLILHTRFNDQEMRSEQSTHITYYEGAAEATDESGKVIGEGYLEMTGYAHSEGW
jgi:predicted secreted hydrolase